MSINQHLTGFTMFSREVGAARPSGIILETGSGVAPGTNVSFWPDGITGGLRFSVESATMVPGFNWDTGGTTVPIGGLSAITSLTLAVGTANDTLQDVTGAFDQTILNNNFQDLVTKINAILFQLRNSGLIIT